MENGQNVGVYVYKCEFEKQNLFCLPTVTVQLVNDKNGENIMGSDHGALTTSPFNALNKRCETPSWDDVLICDYSYENICNTVKSDNIFLFEICENIQEPSSLLKAKELDVVEKRVAWAFLKPVSSNGILNVGKVARLQLYKIGKNCTTSHQNCPLHHLYSQHKRKKFAGSLYVEIKGVVKKNEAVSKTAENEIEIVDGGKCDGAVAETPPATIAVTEWSRLPTQSCKLPNSKLAEIPVSHRGTSCIAFSNSGLHLACGTFSKIVIVGVLDKNDTVRLVGHTGLIYELQWAADDSLLLSVSADCSAIIWNVKPMSKTPYFVLPHPSFVYCGSWLKLGHCIVTGGKDSTIRFWQNNKLGFDLIEEIGGHSGFISALEVNCNNLMFSGDSTGQVLMWMLENNKWQNTRKFSIHDIKGSVIDAIHLHPEKRRIIVTARFRGTIMIDVATKAVLQSYSGAQLNVRSTSCLTPCGSLLLSFGTSNIVHVWECDNGNLIATYEKIFSNISPCEGELSGSIVYHPFEHMAAFAVLGCQFPVVLLQYNYKNGETERLGLTTHIKRDSSAESESKSDNPVKINRESIKYLTDNSTEDKLAAIVHHIDRVLIAKKELTSRLLNHSAQTNKP